jgi:hypothetical protein
MAAGGLAAGMLAPAAFAQRWTGGKFEVSEIGHVVAQATINGEAIQAIFDNGFSETAMDLNYARGRGVAGAQTRMLNGVETIRSVKVNIRLGPVNAEGLRTPLVDMADLPQVGGKECQLIIGRDLLGVMILTLDFDAGAWEAWFEAKAPFIAPKDVAPFRLTRIPEIGNSTCEIFVEGKKLAALFDLGCSQPLLVRESEQTQAWIDSGRCWTTAASATVRGGEFVLGANRITRARAVTIGRQDVANVPVEIHTADDRAFGRYEAVIGAPLIARFLTILDLGGSRLWLKPSSKIGEPFKVGVVGAGTKREGDTLRVVHVGANSPADAAGVKAGDVIVAINGAAPVRRMITDAKPSDVLEFELADKRKIRVAAAEFF